MRWVCDNKINPCKLCKAYDGREWYVNPKPGQLSMESKPKGGLHPNCRCYTEPINEFSWLEEDPKTYVNHQPVHLPQGREFWDTLDQREPGQSPYLYYDETGEDVSLGMACDGRRYPEGPAAGNYLGGGWGYGRNFKEIEKEAERLSEKNGTSIDDEYDNLKVRLGRAFPPMHSADKCAQLHDDGYDACDRDLRKGSITKKEHHIKVIEADRALVNCLKKLSNDPKNWPKPPRPEDEERAATARSAAITIFGSKLFNYDINQMGHQDFSKRRTGKLKGICNETP